jgi:predicted DNA-binding protein
MSTTLKLPPELKERIAKVIGDTGQTAHAFMLEAIRRHTEHAEKRRDFVIAARVAREEFGRTGKAGDWAAVRDRYRAEIAEGKSPKRRRSS